MFLLNTKFDLICEKKKYLSMIWVGFVTGSGAISSKVSWIRIRLNNTLNNIFYLVNKNFIDPDPKLCFLCDGFPYLQSCPCKNRKKNLKTVSEAKNTIKINLTFNHKMLFTLKCKTFVD